MEWFDFRPRTRERDCETDRLRMEQVMRILTANLTQVENERDGLEERYRRSAQNAAFACDAMENGQPSLSRKVDTLTYAMLYCTGRIETLDEQAAFLRTLRGSVISFMADQAGPAPPEA